MEMQKSYGKSEERSILALETMLGKSLPPQYREFLLNVGGGRPVLDELKITDWGVVGIHCFYCLNDTGHIEDIRGPIDRTGHWIDHNLMIPIASDAGGNKICLGVHKKNFGRIYFIDHEVPERPIYLAPDFESFVNSLVAEGTY